MIPTIEQITEEIELSVVHGNSKNQLLEAATHIQKIYEPFVRSKLLKPLPELHKNAETCRMLANHIGFSFQSVKVDEDEVVTIAGRDTDRDFNMELVIWPNGDIFLVGNGADELILNPFKLADFIRSLGFGPVATIHKPLNRIIDDPQVCEEIFKCVYPNEPVTHLHAFSDHILLTGRQNRQVTIWHNGTIESTRSYNPFEMVRKINNRGYDCMSAVHKQLPLLEIKAELYLLYKGLKVLKMPTFHSAHFMDVTVGAVISEDTLRESHLELRSVDSLTSSELEFIHKIEQPIEILDPEKFKARLKSGTEEMKLQSQTYLSRIAVAMPFKEYSVQDMINTGWIKVVNKTRYY